jgi:hypothetical protein
MEGLDFENLGSDMAIHSSSTSNTAINNYLKSGEAMISNFSIDLQTLVQYHVIKGRDPRAQLKQTPLFLPTLATDSTSAANVTGGQRVEVVSSGQQIFFQSGLRRNSTLLTPVCIMMQPQFTC